MCYYIMTSLQNNGNTSNNGNGLAIVGGVIAGIGSGILSSQFFINSDQFKEKVNEQINTDDLRKVITADSTFISAVATDSTFITAVAADSTFITDVADTIANAVAADADADSTFITAVTNALAANSTFITAVTTAVTAAAATTG